MQLLSFPNRQLYCTSIMESLMLFLFLNESPGNTILQVSLTVTTDYLDQWYQTFHMSTCQPSPKMYGTHCIVSTCTLQLHVHIMVATPTLYYYTPQPRIHGPDLVYNAPRTVHTPCAPVELFSITCLSSQTCSPHFVLYGPKGLTPMSYICML